VEKEREKNGRTLTGEIVHRLEDSFRREDQQALIAATISSLVQMLDTLPDNSLLKLAKDMPPEQRDRFLLSFVTKEGSK
jgi:Mg/Co/Ni transporter MgtE